MQRHIVALTGASRVHRRVFRSEKEHSQIALKSANIYLDHNASAPLLPKAREAICDALAHSGNPSSVHAHGRYLRMLIEDARHTLAKLAGADTHQVVFAGSATEALTQAIVGGKKHFGAGRILISAGEHMAVGTAAKMVAATTDCTVQTFGLLPNGTIDLASLEQLIAEADSADALALVVVHAVNNETGIIQPISDIERLVGPSRHVLVIDGVQALGKVEFDFASSAIDMMAVSAHKIGGPAGVGALLVKGHCDEVRLVPGGGQEQGRRGGTESAALIAGFGVACDIYPAAWRAAEPAALINTFENGLRAIYPKLVVFGEQAERIGSVSNCAMPGISNAVLMMKLDLAGISISAGSACSSGKVANSAVLEAMGVAPDTRSGAIRLSVGWNSTKAEIEAVLATLSQVGSRSTDKSRQSAKGATEQSW